MCHQIRVEAATGSTIFDFSITDTKNRVVFLRQAISGLLDELDFFPMNGLYVLTISNATKNEVFNILMVVRET
jgi:hypothetical protein